MPRGPKGEKRPADVIGNAVMVGIRRLHALDSPRAALTNRGFLDDRLHIPHRAQRR